MGQRSQVIIGYKSTEYDRSNYKSVMKQCRFARHLQWNYGAFMVLRASQAVSFLNTAQENGLNEHNWDILQRAQGALATFCVNRVTGNVQGLDESSDESNSKASQWDNNNGLFIADLDPEKGYTFGFCTGREEARTVNGRNIKPLETIVSAREYLEASEWELLADNDAIRSWADTMEHLRTEEDKKRWADQCIDKKNWWSQYLPTALETLEQAEKEHTITAKRAKELMNMTSAAVEVATA